MPYDITSKSRENLDKLKPYDILEEPPVGNVYGRDTGTATIERLFKEFNSVAERNPTKREFELIVSAFDRTNDLRGETISGVINNIGGVAAQNEQEIRTSFRDVVGRDITDDELTDMLNAFNGREGVQVRPDQIQRRLDRIRADEEKAEKEAGLNIDEIADRYNLSPEERDKLKSFQPKEEGGKATGDITDILEDRKNEFRGIYGEFFTDERDIPEDLVEYAANEGLRPYEFRLLVQGSPEYVEYSQDLAAEEERSLAEEQRKIREEARKGFIEEKRPELEARKAERTAEAEKLFGTFGERSKLLREGFEEGLQERESDILNRTIQGLSQLQPYGGSAYGTAASEILGEGLKQRGAFERELALSNLGLSEAERLRIAGLSEREQSLLDAISFGGFEQEQLTDVQSGRDLLSRIYAGNLATSNLGAQYGTDVSSRNYQDALIRAQRAYETGLSDISYNRGLTNIILGRSFDLADAARQEEFLRQYLDELSGGGGIADIISGGLSGLSSGIATGNPYIALGTAAAGAYAGSQR